MTDNDALLRAVCDCPDDDTPRLIYADFLEDNGEAERAEFVRAQIELARTPDWEPFAVLCRTRKREWSEAGEPFRNSLLHFAAGAGVEWHKQPFRRGLGWRLNVRSLHEWNRIAPRLYERATVGELYLNPPATRDDWRAFAAGDWVKHFRVIHLEGTSPVEAIRALCENPAACGITDIHFHRSSSPGLPELVEDLLATPLGRGLKGLHFHVGYQSVDVLVEALASSKTSLERLTLHTMGLTPERLGRLLQTTLARDLRTLSLANDRLSEEANDDDPFAREARRPAWIEDLPQSLTLLHIENAGLYAADLEALASSESLLGLRMLNLNRNYSLRHTDLFFELPALQEVRSLSLRKCEMQPETWRKLVQSRVWSRLTNLNLRSNPVGEAAARRLTQAPTSESLVSIVLTEPRDPELTAQLQERFRERLVLAAAEAG